MKVVCLAYTGDVYKNDLVHMAVTGYNNNKYPKKGKTSQL